MSEQLDSANPDDVVAATEVCVWQPSHAHCIAPPALNPLVALHLAARSEIWKLCSFCLSARTRATCARVGTRIKCECRAPSRPSFARCGRSQTTPGLTLTPLPACPRAGLPLSLPPSLPLFLPPSFSPSLPPSLPPSKSLAGSTMRCVTQTQCAMN